MPSVLPPSGPNDDNSKKSLSVNFVKPAFNSDIISAASANDKDYIKELNSRFNLVKEVSVGKLLDLYKADNPLKLREYFFHFLKALPELSKHIDFTKANNQVEFNNVLNIFAFGADLNDSLSTRKESWVLVNHLLLELKSKTEDEALNRLIDTGLNYSINAVNELSRPGAMRLSGNPPFSPRQFLEERTMAVAKELDKKDTLLTKAYSNLIGAIADRQQFIQLLSDAGNDEVRFETLREDLSANSGDYEQSIHDAKQEQKILALAKKGFSRILQKTENFIRSNQARSGFNGKFKVILENELEAMGNPILNINFQEYDSNDLDLFKQTIKLTLDTVDDSASLGIKEWGFADFFASYAYGNLVDAVMKLEDIDSQKIGNLVKDFFKQDEMSTNFKSFSQLRSLAEAKKLDPYVEYFIDFIDQLKAKALKQKATVTVFAPESDDEAYEGWTSNTDSKKLIFNTSSYGLPSPSNSYKILVTMVKYNPWDIKFSDDDLLSVIQDDGDDLEPSVAMDLNQTLPLSLFSFLNSADQAISDQDVFTLAGADELNTDIDEDFTGEPIMNFQAQSLGFESFAEPNLARVVFIEEKDDNNDDGEGEFDYIPSSDDSLVLS